MRHTVKLCLELELFVIAKLILPVLRQLSVGGLAHEVLVFVRPGFTPSNDVLGYTTTPARVATSWKQTSAAGEEEVRGGKETRRQLASTR